MRLTESGDQSSGADRPQLVRAVAREGMPVALSIDGSSVAAIEGESVLAALLTHGPHLRRLEFGSEPRAGFCLMGACQDCWVWTEDGGRLRACTTLVSEGMALLTTPPAFAAP